MKNLTKRQAEVLAFIRQFIATEGYSPSYEEIGRGVGLSALSTIHKYIRILGRKGHLEYEYNRSRSLMVRGQKTGLRSGREWLERAQKHLLNREDIYGAAMIGELLQ